MALTACQKPDKTDWNRLAEMSAQTEELHRLETARLGGLPPYDRLPTPPIAMCTEQKSLPTCEANQLRFHRAWQKAFHGDTAAQRLIATAQNGNNPGIIHDAREACAWSLIAEGTATPSQASPCTALPDDDRLEADRKALTFRQAMTFR